MANGNGPFLKDGPTPIELGTLELPPDPLKADLVRPPGSLESLGTPGDAQTSLMRVQGVRNTPNLRPLRFHDHDVVSRLERKMHVAKRARAIAAIGGNSERHKRTKYGLLTNPFYRYEGGPLTRIMTFLANLLKLLEQLILGRLKKAPALTLRKKVAPKKKEAGPNSVFTEEEKQLKLKRQKKDLLRI